MTYPLLRKTEHAYSPRDLDRAVATLEDEQLRDLHQLLNDEAYDAQSLEEVVWTVTPKHREEYEVSGVRDLIALIKKSYCFHLCRLGHHRFRRRMQRCGTVRIFCPRLKPKRPGHCPGVRQG